MGAITHPSLSSRIRWIDIARRTGVEPPGFGGCTPELLKNTVSGGVRSQPDTAWIPFRTSRAGARDKRVTRTAGSMGGPFMEEEKMVFRVSFRAQAIISLGVGTRVKVKSLKTRLCLLHCRVDMRVT
jgi:glucose-6-phosphate dehydrogenase assembly protein OpcA